MRLSLILVSFVVLAVSCKKGHQADPLPADDSPVVHSDISPKVEKGCGNYSWHYGDAYKTLREVEDYRPGKRDYYVRELNDRRNEFLLAGISPAERAEWFSSHKTPDNQRHCMEGIFTAIGEAAKKTLPHYQPRGYTHHESGEDDIIKNAVKQEFPEAEIIETGVSSPSWNIDKHSNGIPRSRYKYGMAWVKGKPWDDGYCRIMYINVFQDYAGGSSYADTQPNYISIEPAGCP